MRPEAIIENVIEEIDSVLMKETDQVNPLLHIPDINNINETDKSMIMYETQKTIQYFGTMLEHNKYHMDNIYCPYFTIDEIAQYKDYYAKSNGHGLQDFMEGVQSTVQRSTSRDADVFGYDQLKELEDQLRATNDPEEIGRIKKQMEELGFKAEDHEMLKESMNPSQYHTGESEFDSVGWNKKILELTNKLKSCNSIDEIDECKQQILDHGWNPEIEYTRENQIKAKKRYESIMNEKMYHTFVDVTAFVEQETEDVISESKNDKKIHPIHIVLMKGNRLVSGIISKVTDSNYTHAALCLDNEWENLYSYNGVNNKNLLGGFSIEAVSKIPKDRNLSIFTIFVKNKQYEKIKERCKYLVDNTSHTIYSWLGLITYPFSRINFQNADNMICSEFVDATMKMINVDITGKKSNKVSPADLYRSSVKNGKIYKVFEGLAGQFNPKKINTFVNKLSRNAKSISECNTITDAYLTPVVMEARKFPIEVKNNGDVLLTKVIIDYDAEYSNSHKLLKQYEKTGSIESMKYELARLYYMNYMLEKKIYHNNQLRNKEKNIKTRARILNDFNKYLDIVLKKQPGFNFGKYYEASPFYANTIEVKGSTIVKAKEIINNIL